MAVRLGSSLNYLSCHIWGCVFSLPISLKMIARIPVLDLIIFFKSDVWPICPCFGLGHETTHWTVCLSIFLRLLMSVCDWFLWAQTQMYCIRYVVHFRCFVLSLIVLCAKRTDVLPKYIVKAPRQPELNGCGVGRGNITRKLNPLSLDFFKI